MKKSTAMKKLIESGELTTNLLKPLGISFESFLKLAQRSDADALVKKLIAKYEAALPTVLAQEKAELAARRALARGDLDEAFDHALDAALPLPTK